MKLLNQALLAVAATVTLGAGTAHAVSVTPTVILPGAISYQYFGFNFAENIETSSSVGVLDYGGQPGCGGTCVATTALGANPFVSLNVDEIAYEATGGGYAQAELSYSVEYVDPGAAADTMVNVVLHANDSFSANIAAYPGYAEGQTYIAIGAEGGEPGFISNFGSYIYQDTDCVNYCQEGVANYLSPAPIPANVPLSILANTPYLVLLSAEISPGTTGVQLQDAVDPTFSTSATGGYFAFSPGVTSGAIPEPATWAMMLVGLGGLGAAVRARRRAMAFA
jgi:hypothetical protein